MNTFKRQEFSFKPKKDNQSVVRNKSPKDVAYEATRNNEKVSTLNLAQRTALGSPFRHRQIICSPMSPESTQHRFSQRIRNLGRFMSQSNTPRGNSFLNSGASKFFFQKNKIETSLDQAANNHVHIPHEQGNQRTDGIVIPKKLTQEQKFTFKSA